MSDINKRLIGRTYNTPNDEFTVVDTIPGLRAGFVTVTNEKGEKGTEKLSNVLFYLDNLEPDLERLAQYISISNSIEEKVNELAAIVVGNEGVDFLRSLEEHIYNVDAARSKLGSAVDDCENQLAVSEIDSWLKR